MFNNCSDPAEGGFCQAAAPAGSDGPRLLPEVATAGSISRFLQWRSSLEQGTVPWAGQGARERCTAGAAAGRREHVSSRGAPNASGNVWQNNLVKC